MDEIVLPMESQALDDESYAYYIFRHRLDGLGTFIGEVLLSMGLFEKEYIYKNEDIIQLQLRLFLNDMPEDRRQQMINLRDEHGRTDEIMEQTSWFYEDPVPSPEIVWNPRKERQNLTGDLLRGLFHTGITQLVSIYEILLGDIARTILKSNPILLAIKERQLTSEELISLQSYERIIEVLIERAISKLTYTTSYPDTVNRFHQMFHVGIHDKNSPVQLFPVFHLIEKRNIIVHNDGVASSTYTEKIHEYTHSDILEKDDELPISFVAFYNDLQMIREIGIYIETCVQERWPDLPYL